MTVVTRFAPSPTGMLHIGGARTALFSYLYARHHGGEFKLRIEDTDANRSTPEATQAILDGLKWLGVSFDGEPVFQSKRGARHKQIAEELVKRGAAYYCYTTAEELAAQRAAAEAKGEQFKYNRQWRDSTATPPAGAAPSIRIKAPLEGEVVVRDAVQGDVRFGADALDDFVILRGDGTPTYMLAVVVDDHDMAVTHIIRGDDHLTNAGRQLLIYQAMGWGVPQFAHIPLIHGPDGKKLSKRHGAAAVTDYRDMGYLPEALRNYLLRLGWSHGDAEIISDEDAIRWFNLEAIGQAPARLDFAKLNHVNAHYIKEMDSNTLSDGISNMMQLSEVDRALLRKATPSLQSRAHTLVELFNMAQFYLRYPSVREEKAQDVLNKSGENLKLIIPALTTLETWDAASIKQLVNDTATAAGKKLGELMPPMRAAIVGTMSGPDIPDAMAILGKAESLKRLQTALDA